MEKEIYTPMERVLIEGAKKLTTKEICDEALETKKKELQALELDLLLLDMETKLIEQSELAGELII